jgi:hypothetical protein
LNTTVGNPEFSFSLPATTLSSGEQVEGTITYCASGDDNQTTLSIESDDPDEPLALVTLRGNTPLGLEPGEEALDFTLSSVNGFGDITLSDLRGKVVVITFFASW